MLDPAPVAGRQLWRPARPRRALQRRATALGQLLYPPAHRLPMDADTPRDLGLADPSLQQPRGAETPLFELPTILSHPGWMSHGPKYIRCVAKCHYVM